jgi:acyl-coenzyme A thioesterase PaaI-like protein
MPWAPCSGGALFAMTDPFYPLMLQHNLGRDYTVWTKSAAVQFLSPRRTIARVSFLLSGEVLHEIRAATEGGKKCEPEFFGLISDPGGRLIAKVDLTLHVRRKCVGDVHIYEHGPVASALP